MLEDMETTGPTIDGNAISATEFLLGKQLPLDYKKFLLKYNGGEPIQRAINFQADKIHQSSDYIASFYEISEDVSYGILPNLKNHGYRLPNGLIYIANTPGGNYFLLSLRDDSYGQIFYKDHEFEDKSEFDPTNDILPESIVKVANNFSELESQLYDPDK